MNEAQAQCPRCQETPGWHAGLHAGHVWTETRCPAYRTLDGSDCTCREAGSGAVALLVSVPGLVAVVVFVVKLAAVASVALS